jgi:hypothetical protein
VSCIKQYEAAATARFSEKICKFRCDNGGEYVSNELKEFFAKKGIQIEYTIPYSPALNVVSERMNRTLLDKARSKLIGSGLPKNQWVEAVLSAVYSLNRSPTKALEMVTPAEKWYGVKPELSKVRVFGNVAYLHKQKELQAWKSDRRSRKCFMVGYCPNVYRLWCPVEKKITAGRDVKFDEGSVAKTKRNTANFEFDVSDNKESIGSEAEKENLSEWDCNVDNGGNNSDPVAELRSERIKKPPKYLEDNAACAYNIESYVNNVPEGYEELADRSDKENWLQAVHKELESLEDNKTWEIVSKPIGKKVRVRVTLRLTVSQSVCLGVEPRLALMTRYLFFIES